MQFSPQKKSFTLIEMLIVIVIIGILGAALIPRLQSIQWRARDSKRKVDLRTIYNANEIYFTDNQQYPRAFSSANYNTTQSTYSRSPSRTWLLIGYLTSIPTDPVNAPDGVPRNSVTPSYTYAYYWVYNTNGWTYDLLALLESTSDPDRCGTKVYSGNNNSVARCHLSATLVSGQLYDISPNVKNSVY